MKSTCLKLSWFALIAGMQISRDLETGKPLLMIVYDLFSVTVAMEKGTVDQLILIKITYNLTLFHYLYFTDLISIYRPAGRTGNTKPATEILYGAGRISPHGVGAANYSGIFEGAGANSASGIRLLWRHKVTQCWLKRRIL